VFQEFAFLFVISLDSVLFTPVSTDVGEPT